MNTDLNTKFAYSYARLFLRLYQLSSDLTSISAQTRSCRTPTASPVWCGAPPSVFRARAAEAEPPAVQPSNRRALPPSSPRSSRPRLAASSLQSTRVPSSLVTRLCPMGRGARARLATPELRASLLGKAPRPHTGEPRYRIDFGFGS